MKFPKPLANTMIYLAQKDHVEYNLSDFCYFFSPAEQEYVKKYLENEPDISPKTAIDKKIFDETNELSTAFKGLKTEAAFTVAEKMSAQGNSSAIYYCGCCLCTGKGCSMDVMKGLELIGQAAALDHPWAQYILGNLYYNGVLMLPSQAGTVPSEAQDTLDQYGGYQERDFSAFWKYRAAINGCPNAQYLFADDCLYGSYDIYFSLDDDLMHLFELAAEQGMEEAQIKVVRILLNDKPNNTFFNLEKGIAAAKKYNLYYNADINHKINTLLKQNS